MANKDRYIYNLGLSFQQTVKNYPENFSLLNAEIRLTYSELNNKANLLAKHFLEKNLQEKNIICVPADKSELSFISVIACLKLGICYVFYDVETPSDRIKKIINNCRPSLIILPEGQKNFFFEDADFSYPYVTSTELAKVTKTAKKIDDLIETTHVTGEHPAYIMYTSGSTGEPKGVLIKHAQVLNFIKWCIATFGFNSKDVLTNINPLYFDNSVFDFYSALFSGATLVPIHKEQAQFPQAMLEILQNYECTSWYSVPSLLMYYQSLKVFDGGAFFGIKKIIFGGEGFPLSKLKELFDSYKNQIEFFNVYGPTECTCMCCAHLMQENDFTKNSQYPPLGQIAENFSYMIVDEFCNQVPAGEIGELCLLGANVSIGYFNNPVKTFSSFIQNPSNSNYKEIMYKTGDLVSWKEKENKLYIFGRKDNQIKLMGYRIELEEVENTLMSLHFIDNAVVLPIEENGKVVSLMAVVKASSLITENEIFLFLKEKLPQYMLPKKLIFLDKMPFNANGKVDRKGLLHSLNQNSSVKTEDVY